MRIVFNLHNVGLGNNGGSRTLLKCAETLARLGQDVIMYSNIKSGYTWHTPKGVVFVHGDKCPECDVVVATGFGSVRNTVNAPAKKKFYYIRGFEKWAASKLELFATYKSLHCIVNSEWLKDMLLRNGIESNLVYPGLDLDKYYQMSSKRKGMGALFSKRHLTKRHQDAVAISKIVPTKLKMLNKDLVNATEDQAREFYNSIKVWLSPTELEGLHNPPIEAILCGCALVCNDHLKNGMTDYAIHGETALIYKSRDLVDASNCVRKLLNDEPLRTSLVKNASLLLKEKIGTREENMKKLIFIFKESE